MKNNRKKTAAFDEITIPNAAETTTLNDLNVINTNTGGDNGEMVEFLPEKQRFPEVIVENEEENNGNNMSDVPAEKLDENHGKRDEWTNKLEYLLSVIGYVVDLGNCVRFPYVTYKNGGGAFLIPYFIFLVLIGVPMMYMELSIGQYYKVGNIKLWGQVNGYMKGKNSFNLLFSF